MVVSACDPSNDEFIDNKDASFNAFNLMHEALQNPVEKNGLKYRMVATSEEDAILYISIVDQE
jgi:hypothetical protein